MPVFIFAAPDDPPQQLISTSSMTSVTLQWSPPQNPNGIIHRYLLSIFTAGNTITKELHGNQRAMPIGNLQPSQLYTVTVITSTLVNGIFADSPSAVLNISTLPNGVFS